MWNEARKDKLIYALSIVLNRFINGRKNPGSLQVRHILVIRRDEIGDLCYTLPVIDALARQFPNSPISFWCQPFAAPLMQSHPAISELITRNKGPERPYDLVVDLRGKWEGLHYALRYRPKYRLERGIVRLRNRRNGGHPHEMETNLQVIAGVLDKPYTPAFPMAFYVSEEDRQWADDFYKKTLAGKPFAVLHPGARRELRRWPAAHFKSLIRHLHDQYDFTVLLSGDASEKELCSAIAASAEGSAISLAGVTSLPAFVSLAARAVLFVGNESGPLHLAAVQGVPSVGLYGPGEPHVFYPPAGNSRVIHHLLDCNPCDQIHCVHPESPCISRIQLSEVIAAIDSLLGEKYQKKTSSAGPERVEK